MKSRYDLQSVLSAASKLSCKRTALKCCTNIKILYYYYYYSSIILYTYILHYIKLLWKCYKLAGDSQSVNSEWKTKLQSTWLWRAPSLVRTSCSVCVRPTSRRWNNSSGSPLRLRSVGELRRTVGRWPSPTRSKVKGGVTCDGLDVATVSTAASNTAV